MITRYYYLACAHKSQSMGARLATHVSALLCVDVVGSDEVVAQLHKHFNEGSDAEPCSLDATRVAIHNALCILARLIQADYTGAAASRAWSQRVVADYCAALGRKDFAGALRVAETAALDTRYKELVVVYTFHGRGVPFAHVLQGSPGAPSAA